MSKFCRKWFGITSQQFSEWLENFDRPLNQEISTLDESENLDEEADFDDDNWGLMGRVKIGNS